MSLCPHFILFFFDLVQRKFHLFRDGLYKVLYEVILGGYYEQYSVFRLNGAIINNGMLSLIKLDQRQYVPNSLLNKSGLNKQQFDYQRKEQFEIGMNIYDYIPIEEIHKLKAEQVTTIDKLISGYYRNGTNIFVDDLNKLMQMFFNPTLKNDIN